MLIIIRKRDKSAKAHIVGSALVMNGYVEYIHGVDEFEKLLNTARIAEILGEEFDTFNLEHWKKLPELYSGVFTWVELYNF